MTRTAQRLAAHVPLRLQLERADHVVDLSHDLRATDAFEPAEESKVLLDRELGPEKKHPQYIFEWRSIQFRALNCPYDASHPHGACVSVSMS